MEASGDAGGDGNVADDAYVGISYVPVGGDARTDDHYELIDAATDDHPERIDGPTRDVRYDVVAADADAAASDAPDEPECYPCIAPAGWDT